MPFSYLYPVCSTTMEPSEKNVKTDIREERWYAVYTRPKAEKMVFARLIDIGIETFLPVQKTLKQWSDRKKIVEKPLIPSYIFVRTWSKFFPKVYRTEGVVRFVNITGLPSPVTQREIDNLKLLVNSDAEVELVEELFERGQQVEVTAGACKGLTGELVSSGDRKRMLVRIESLNKNILVNIPVNFLKKLRQ